MFLSKQLFRQLDIFYETKKDPEKIERMRKL